MNKMWGFLLIVGISVSANAKEVSGYIVKLHSEPTAKTFQILAATSDTTRLRSDSPVYLVNDLAAVSALAADADYIEANQEVHIFKVQETAFVPPRKAEVYPNDWGQKAIHIDESHRAGATGKGVVVAIIDTGVDASHPELKGKVLVNEGYNFADDKQDATDDNGHGTHCAGIIAAKNFGAAPDVKILPIKFITKEGSGTTATAIQAVDYAVSKKVDVMSNSWGGRIKSQALADSFKAAINAGIIVIAAAGNDQSNNDTKPSFPANYPGVVSVGAIDKDLSLADFSNFGQKVLIGAPGVKIYSSVLENDYEQYDGTSMAAPFVAGVAALYQSVKHRSVTDFRACLKKTADVASPRLAVETGGLVNAERVVTECD